LIIASSLEKHKLWKLHNRGSYSIVTKHTGVCN
jgi:hypothetical protein